MTIDSINGQRPLLISTASSEQVVSTTQQQTFQQQLNAMQPQQLLDQASQALVDGESKRAARYLGEAAQKIGGAQVTVSSASDYR
ncbi:MAG: hypothetical protein ACRBHB_15000 [Arenicella sp.]